MKDRAGREIQVGDKIAMLSPWYKELLLGEVDSFTPLMVRCIITKGGNIRTEKVNRYPSDIVIIDRSIA